MLKTSIFRILGGGGGLGQSAWRVAQTRREERQRRVCPPPEDTSGGLRPKHLFQPTRPGGPTCSRVRRRNSWESSSGCSSSSSESVQLRHPTSPAIVVARRPQMATHKAPRSKRSGSDVWAGTQFVVTLGAPRVRSSSHGWGLSGLVLLAYFLRRKKWKGVCRGNRWHCKSGRKSGESTVHKAGHDWSHFLWRPTEDAKRDSEDSLAARGRDCRR